MKNGQRGNVGGEQKRKGLSRDAGKEEEKSKRISRDSG